MQQPSGIAAWGRSAYGQTNCPSGNDYAAIAAGSYHALALRRNGALVGWGASSSGQTNCPSGNDYKAIAAGLSHSLALRQNGALVGWGDGNYGQTNCPRGNDYVMIAAGLNHSLALRADGRLVGWGDNNRGQINCPAGNDYVAIAASYGSSLALRRDGSLVAWGESSYGQTACPAGNDYVQIAVGLYHSLALRQDGTLVAWGRNTNGQTGCPAGDDYVAIAAGYKSSLALRQDGTLVGWGQQQFALPGNNYASISLGEYHAVALRFSLFVDITNLDAAVAYAVATCTIAGTNSPLAHSANKVVGTMEWTNALNGMHGHFPARDAWAIQHIALSLGTNHITVTGTNAYGWEGTDSLVVMRVFPVARQLVLVAPEDHFLTNSFVVPFAVACGEGIKSIYLATNSTPSFSPTQVFPYKSSVTLSGTGTFYWTASGYDITNSQCWSSTTNRLTIQKTLVPGVRLVSPAHCTVFTNTFACRFQVDYGAAIVEQQLSTNNGQSWFAYGADNPVVFNYVGAYRWTARGKNHLGWWWYASQTNTITVRTDYRDIRAIFPLEPADQSTTTNTAPVFSMLTFGSGYRGREIQIDHGAYIPVSLPTNIALAYGQHHWTARGAVLPRLNYTYAPTTNTFWVLPPDYSPSRVCITSDVRVVPYATTMIVIAGTNAYGSIGNNMRVANTESGGDAMSFACHGYAFIAPAIPLLVGMNRITVDEVHAAGVSKRNTITIWRANVDGGGEHAGSTYSRRSSGTLVGWGDNTFGQSTCPPGDDFVAVDAGWVHSLALRKNGTLVGWGKNTSGQTNCPSGTNYVAIAAGGWFSLALCSDGTLVGWGNPCPSGSNYAAIAAGWSHALALRTDGSLSAWGDDSYGQVQCPTGNDFVAIAAGDMHSLALRSNGTLVGWGDNKFGQCNCPPGDKFVAVAAGNAHSLALQRDGTLVGWGKNDHGEINAQCVEKIITVMACDRHTLALHEDGTLFGLGMNERGVLDCPRGDSYVAVATGARHSLALRGHARAALRGAAITDDIIVLRQGKPVRGRVLRYDNGTFVYATNYGITNKVVETGIKEILNDAPEPDAAASYSSAGTMLDLPALFTPIRKSKMTRLVGVMGLPAWKHCGPVRSVAVVPNGTIGVSAGFDGVVYLWDLATGDCTRMLTTRTMPISELTLSPGGTRVLVIYADGQIAVVDVGSGAIQLWITTGLQNLQHAAVFPDGSRVVVAASRYPLAVFSVANGKLLAMLGAHSNEKQITGLSVTPDGRHVRVSFGTTMDVYDVRSGQCLESNSSSYGDVPAGSGADAVEQFTQAVVRELQLLERIRGVQCRAVTPDGQFMFTGSQDGNVMLWNLETGVASGTVAGHRGAITAIGFLGSQLVTAGADNTVRLWYGNGREAKTLARRYQRICLLAGYKADTLVIGSDYGTVLLDLATGAQQPLRGAEYTQGLWMGADGKSVLCLIHDATRMSSRGTPTQLRAQKNPQRMPHRERSQCAGFSHLPKCV